MALPITLEDIRAAGARIRGAVYRSPCPYSLSLSRLSGCEIYCKLDHLQLTGSFKERGARNKLLLLMNWHLGPEIRSTQTRMQPPPQPDMQAVAALPPRSQEELLDAIRHSVYNQPSTDWS